MFIMFKNTFRTFFKSKSQTVIILMLLIFSGFYFSLIYNTIIPIANKYEKEKVSSNIEQFRFYPSFELSDDEIFDLSKEYKINPEDFAIMSMEELSEKYKIDLSIYSEKYSNLLSKEFDFKYDKYNYKNVTKDNTLFSITPYNGNINKNIITKGTFPSKDDEIAIGIGYASANNIEIGSQIKILDSLYKASGFYYDLGNTYVYDAASSKTVFAKDNAKILTTQNEYNAIDVKDNLIYFGKLNKPQDNIESQIQKMVESEKFLYVMPSSSVSSTSMFNMTLQSQLSMMYFGSILIFIITAIFISMFISGHVKKSKKQFGIMLAMGFKKSRIIASYLFLPLMFIILIIFGTLLGYSGRSFMTNQLSMGFNYPVEAKSINIMAMVTFAVIYSAVIGIFMIFKIFRSLSKKPLDLISSNKSNRKYHFGAFIRKAISRLPFKQHIKYSFAFSKISRFIIMSICVFISMILINLALSLYSGYNKGVQTFESDTSFTNIVTYNEVKALENNEKYENEFLKTSAFLSKINEKKIGKTIDIEFVDFKTVPINFNVDKNKVGVIVPLRYKYQNDLQVGDVISIKSKKSTLKQKIIGFSKLSVNNTFYISNELISSFDSSLENSSYNGEYLINKNNNNNEYYSVVKKTTLVNQIKEMQQNSSSIIIILIIFSFFASFFMVNIISGNNISDNIQGIMIMIMSGYKKKDISSLLLNIYSIAILFGTVITVSVLPSLLKSVTMMINTSDIGFIEISFSFINVLISFVLVIAIYYFSLFISKNRYLKLNIREVMTEE